MKTYIIEVCPFPFIIGKDKIVKVQSEDELDTILQKLKVYLEKENPMFEYDLYGYTLEDFVKGIELIELDDKSNKN